MDPMMWLSDVVSGLLGIWLGWTLGRRDRREDRRRERRLRVRAMIHECEQEHAFRVARWLRENRTELVNLCHAAAEDGSGRASELEGVVLGMKDADLHPQHGDAEDALKERRRPLVDVLHELVKWM